MLSAIGVFPNSPYSTISGFDDINHFLPVLIIPAIRPNIGCSLNRSCPVGSVAWPVVCDILAALLCQVGNQSRYVSSRYIRSNNGHSYRQRNRAVPGNGRTLLRRVPQVHGRRRRLLQAKPSSAQQSSPGLPKVRPLRSTGQSCRRHFRPAVGLHKPLELDRLHPPVRRRDAVYGHHQRFRAPNGGA